MIQLKEPMLNIRNILGRMSKNGIEMICLQQRLGLCTCKSNMQTMNILDQENKKIIFRVIIGIVIILSLVNLKITMKGTIWRGKKTLKRWQLQKQLDGHLERLRQVRPLSCDPEWQPPTLNLNKKMMLQQDKVTEIEKQNRYLLEKITTTMNKKTSLSQRETQKDKMNRTLNTSFRRKQLQTIEVENARLLKRLQQKKSNYDRTKMKQEWKKQKQMLKNISEFPFIIKPSGKNHRRGRTVSKQQHNHSSVRSPKNQSNTLSSDIEMVRIRTIDNQHFIVTVKLDSQNLTIIGDQRKNVPKKIIKIPKEQALAFIQGECLNKIDGIFDRLAYSQEQDVLYLIGNLDRAENALMTIKEKISILQQDKVPVLE